MLGSALDGALRTEFWSLAHERCRVVATDGMKTLVRYSIAVAASAAAAAAIRYAIIERTELAHLCESPDAPPWCMLRAVVVAILATATPGIAALVAGIVATLTRSSTWGLVAVCLGAVGLLLYAVETGAIAFLLGLLVLARRVAAGLRPPGASGKHEA